MNLSKQSRAVIDQIGQTIATMFAVKLTPLQILILCETRYLEAQRGKGEHVLAQDVRKNVTAALEARGGIFKPSRQAFWDAFNHLRKNRGMLFIAPPSKNTTRRAMALTAVGARLFTYPKSIHPFRETS